MGTFTGDCEIIGPTSGSFDMVIGADGTVTGDVQASVTSGMVEGTCTPDGQISASGQFGSVGTCAFDGAIDDQGSMSGLWSCTGDCDGTWTGSAV
jgi:hypothetical protein